MVSKYMFFACHIWLVILHELVSCDIIENTTQKSVAASQAKGARQDRSGRRNTTTPLLSTRSNFISASTVLNPPRTATQPVDWTPENFRRWVKFKYSRKRDGLLGIPDELLNNPEPRPVEVGDEHEDIYTENPQHHDAGSSKDYSDEVSNYYIFKNQERNQQGNLDAVIPYFSASESTPSGIDLLQYQVDENNTTSLQDYTVNDGESLTQNSSTSMESSNHDAFGESQILPLAEALHSPDDVKEKLKNITNVNNDVKQEISKVSQEPIDKDSLLENLTDIQFSWVDIIIAVCCTAAILLILINIGVCIQYCMHKKNRMKRFRRYTVPLSAALRMRMDSVRLRKPSLRNRPWVNCNRSIFGKYGTHRIMWPSVDTNSHGTHDSASTDVSMLSLHSADKGTQYENTDAMIASFVNSDLIVELNDRDSACTSISDGFTFSREYGTPKALHSSVTDL